MQTRYRFRPWFWKGAKVNGEIFNVGATPENYRIRQIAAIVAEARERLRMLDRQ